jgi:tRNA threonylcarbamoyladenosine biosynthesis protein TsaB
MTVMAWDTATAFTCAAIVRVAADGSFEIAAEFQAEGGSSHSQVLPPQAEAMLQSAGLTAGDLNLLAVGRGPGSFTGLRTGLSLAKGLAMGADIPLMGISTLEIMAAEMIFANRAKLAAPVIDARHREIFTALYRASEGGGLALDCLIEPRPVAPAEFAALITAAAPEGGVTVAGSGLDVLGGFLSGQVNILAGQAQLAPSAVMLARLAAHRLKLEGIDEAIAANPPLPMYIRQPDIRPSGIVLK